MSSRHADLKATAALAVVSACGVLLLPTGALRTLCAVVLCLAAPGYALAAALLPTSVSELAVRLMVVLLVSLAVLALGSLVLHLTLGISSATWVALLLLLVLGGCLVAARRRTPADGLRLSVRRPGLSRSDVGLLLLAAATLAVSVAMARTPFPAANVVGYTQMWMLPAGTTQQPALDVGVQSAEQHPVAYRLELRVGTITSVVEPQFVLRPGGRFEQRVRVPVLTGDGRQKATALLYRLDRPAVVYRRVTAGI